METIMASIIPLVVKDLKRLTGCLDTLRYDELRPSQFKPHPSAVRALLHYDEHLLNFSQFQISGKLSEVHNGMGIVPSEAQPDLKMSLERWPLDTQFMPMFGIRINKLRWAYLYFFGEIPRGCRVVSLTSSTLIHPRNLTLMSLGKVGGENPTCIQAVDVGTKRERYDLCIHRAVGLKYIDTRLASYKTKEEALQVYRDVQKAGGFIAAHFNYLRYTENKVYINGQIRNLFD
jgi:hypothetical protein